MEAEDPIAELRYLRRAEHPVAPQQVPGGELTETGLAPRASREPRAIPAAAYGSDVGMRQRIIIALQRSVGNQAVGTLLSALQRQFDEETVDDPRRSSVVDAAKGELGKVVAKKQGGADDTGRPLRQGWVNLDTYFEASYGGKPGSGYTPELQKRVKYLNAGWPQHWCGHFSMWALKSGGINIGKWVVGGGASSVSGIERTAKPKLGDVGYVEKPFQHHFIIEKVEGSNIHSIDGNSGTNSEITRTSRPRSNVTAFYKVAGVT